MVVKEVKENPRIWRIEEINRQIYLIHSSAQIKENEIGTLIHNWQNFSEVERKEINESLNIVSRQNFYDGEEQKHLASLIKQRSETKDKIPGTIEEVIRFKTGWSNYNVATVINYHEDYYRAFLVVYEPPQNDGKIKEVLETFEINNGYDKSSLESARSKVRELRNELNGENPILAIIGSYGTISPSSILSKPYVLEREIPHEKKEYYGGCDCIPTHTICMTLLLLLVAI